MKRREFLKGILLSGCAPAIVHCENLMKLWVPKQEIVVVGHINEIKVSNRAKFSVIFYDNSDFTKEWWVMDEWRKFPMK